MEIFIKPLYMQNGLDPTSYPRRPKPVVLLSNLLL